MANNKELEALKYHEAGKPGKLEVIPTKILSTQRDLALAYSPGVAVPCLEIADNPENVYRYTAKGNLVAVITNGTGVLGLGNIGPLASKPVMEAKAVWVVRQNVARSRASLIDQEAKGDFSELGCLNNFSSFLGASGSSLSAP